MRLVSLLLCLVLSSMANADSRTEEQLDAIAKELLTKLENAGEWRMDRWMSMAGIVDEKSVAVWPFKADEIPVPQAIAERWSRLLESAIVRAKKTGLRVVTRSDLKTVLEETQVMSAFEQVENPTVALSKNARVSALIIGSIRPNKQNFDVSFQAIEVQTGAILAASREYEFETDVVDASRNQDVLTFDAALDQAANHFAQSNLPLETMEVYGIHEARSKEVTDFSSFVTERFSLNFAEAFTNFMPDNRLKIVEADIYAPINARATTLSRSSAPKNDPYKFRFEGSYWQLDDLLDLRLSLTNAAGERAAWTGKIKTDTIPATLLDYTPSTELGGRNDTGPIGLKLASSKGRNPAYKIGEDVILWVETERDAYLNCFYKQADGVGFKVFPNKFLQEEAGIPQASKGFMRGGEPVEIPGSYSGFKFTAQAPTGHEEVHCLATDKDISGQLPEEIGMVDLTPIPGHQLERLSNIYREIEGVRLSEATMTLSIREK